MPDHRNDMKLKTSNRDEAGNFYEFTANEILKMMKVGSLPKKELQCLYVQSWQGLKNGKFKLSGKVWILGVLKIKNFLYAIMPV